MKHTDQLGQNTYYGYDAYGNQTSVTLPNGGTTAYIYENNKPTTAKNANNALWIWEYNEEGRLHTRVGPITTLHGTSTRTTCSPESPMRGER